MVDDMGCAINILGDHAAQIHTKNPELPLESVVESVLNKADHPFLPFTTRVVAMLQTPEYRRGVIADIKGMAHSVLDKRVFIDSGGFCFYPNVHL